MYRVVFLFLSMIFLFGCSANLMNVQAKESSSNLQTAADFNVRLGLGYLKEKQIARSKSKLLLALKQAPSSSEVQMAMGYFFLQTGQIENARQYYEQALQLDSNSGSVQNNYGVFLFHAGDYKKAINYFKKAAKNPNYLNTAAAYENAGLCALKIPNRSLASFYFKKALKYDSKRKRSMAELKRLMGHFSE